METIYPEMTIDEIEAQFDGEWVLVGDPELDPYQKVARGKVLCHSRDRDEVYGFLSSTDISEFKCLASLCNADLTRCNLGLTGRVETERFMVSDSSLVPKIDVQELKRFIESLLPHAQIVLRPINPEYQSWQIEVIADELNFEYSWGPLSGFGFTDQNEDLGENQSPFAPYDINLESLEQAKDCLRQLLARR